MLKTLFVYLVYKVIGYFALPKLDDIDREVFKSLRQLLLSINFISMIIPLNFYAFVLYNILESLFCGQHKNCVFNYWISIMIGKFKLSGYELVSVNHFINGSGWPGYVYSIRSASASKF